MLRWCWGFLLLPLGLTGLAGLGDNWNCSRRIGTMGMKDSGFIFLSQDPCRLCRGLHFEEVMEALGLFILEWITLMWLVMLEGFLRASSPIGLMSFWLMETFLVLVGKLFNATEPGPAAISKVKVHADEGLVRGGRVREADKVGNDMADRAADFGRRRVGADVIDARRNHPGACGSWYPVIRDLHRFFFIAMTRPVVNDDGKGGIAPHPMVWSSGGRPKLRRAVEAVRDFAMLPGPQRLCTGSWFKWPDIFITADDVSRWPFSIGALEKMLPF